VARSALIGSKPSFPMSRVTASCRPFEDHRPNVWQDSVFDAAPRPGSTFTLCQHLRASSLAGENSAQKEVRLVHCLDLLVDVGFP